MAPASRGPQCGFSVAATKKGEVPLRVEKRAKGKKVTIISNVNGDAVRLVRALQTLLGTGGSVRQAEKGSWAVEVQGDQVSRVTKALLDFDCLKGLSANALQDARTLLENKRSDVVVDRTAATKFLAQTQSGAASSAEAERKRALEQEAEFYGRFWSVDVEKGPADMSDVWEETLDDSFPAAPADKNVSTTASELNIALQVLGMLSETGRAVKEFWQTGMTIERFRKIALNPGARFVGEGPRRKEAPSNLKSRQKLSDWKTGGARMTYFSPHVSAIERYERGQAGEKDVAQTPTIDATPEMIVEEDEAGWCRALLSYCVPLPTPPSRLDESALSEVSKKALRSIEEKIAPDLEGIQQSIPGVVCFLDSSTFGLDLSLQEKDFLQGPKRDTGRTLTAEEKDELRLEKKLREICALKRRQVEGETLDKLQAEKVAKRTELFREVAESKLRRAEKELLKVFKRYVKSFQDAFWEKEWQALYGDEATTSAGSKQVPFGIFDKSRCEGPVTVSSDGSVAESRAPRWVGVPLHLLVQDGEVAAFAIEILEGLVRLGWAAPGAALADLGTTKGGFGFGGTGKKVTGGSFDSYGKSFGAGDVIHCEAEREDGRLRIGFAKNNEALGVAFDVADDLGKGPGLSAVVCGKGFKVKIVSAESMRLEDDIETTAGSLPGFVEYQPPRLAVATRNYSVDDEDSLVLWKGETVNVSSDDGQGWLFGFFLDPEDPDDGGWFPADCVQFFEEHEVELEVTRTPQEKATNVTSSNGFTKGYSDPATVPAQVEGGAVDGLDDWLQKLSLQKYALQAHSWCSEMGAVSLEEVEESWEDFADALSLKPLERKRLAKAVGA